MLAFQKGGVIEKQEVPHIKYVHRLLVKTTMRSVIHPFCFQGPKITYFKTLPPPYPDYLQSHIYTKAIALGVFKLGAQCGLLSTFACIRQYRWESHGSSASFEMHNQKGSMQTYFCNHTRRSLLLKVISLLWLVAHSYEVPESGSNQKAVFWNLSVSVQALTVCRFLSDVPALHLAKHNNRRSVPANTCIETTLVKARLIARSFSWAMRLFLKGGFLVSVIAWGNFVEMFSHTFDERECIENVFLQSHTKKSCCRASLPSCPDCALVVIGCVPFSK